MENNENKKAPASLRDWIMVCVGLVLILLMIIGATDKTFIGQFLTYSSAYLFGLFYPAFFVFVAVLGAKLAFSKRLFPFKKYAMMWIGLSLLFLTILGFGSFSVYRQEQADFSTLNAVYQDRMQGFASRLFQVSDFGFLSGLGGGYFGLLLLTLFGSVWGVIGDAIFLSLLLIFSLFLISFRPIQEEVSKIKEKKAKKAKYNSPYQGKDSKHLDRNQAPIDSIPPLTDNSPLGQVSPSSASSIKHQGGFTTTELPIKDIHEAELQNTPTPIPSPAPTPIPDHHPITSPEPIHSYPQNTPIPSSPVTGGSFSQSGITSSPSHPYSQHSSGGSFSQSGYVQQPASYSHPSSSGSFSQASPATQPNPYSQPSPSGSFGTSSPVPEQTPYANQAVSQNNYFRSSASFEKNTPAQEVPSSPVYSQGGFSSSYDHLTPEQNQMASKRAQDFSDRANSPESSTFEVTSEPVQVPDYYRSPNIPDAPEMVRQTPVSAPKEEISNEFKVEPIAQPQSQADTFVVPQASAPAPAQKGPSAEELAQMEEDAKVAKFFKEKRERELLAYRNKQAEKEARKRELYQYVSPIPVSYNYPLPTSELLEEKDDSNKLQENSEAAQKKAAILNGVFHDYNIKASVVSFTIGPSVTRFNVQIEPGEKSERLNGILNEIQKSMNGDKSVRIETVVEGNSTSGIEIANAKSMAVSFKEVYRTIEKDDSNRLNIPVGKEIAKNIICYPLNKMPHLLVAGTTGSGKSVLIHSIIMTLIMRNYPSQLKLVLIDPKQVEFARYNGESHLFCPVITKPRSAVTALRKLCDEMDHRFSILSKCGCTNYEDYMRKRVGNEANMPEFPQLVCVIDEFADLMQTAGDEAADAVQRIAQKARACAIYLIIATQRPSKDTVPMIIKSNIPCRIALSVSTSVDSRVILDRNGAESLLGKGDLLFMAPGNKFLIRCQSPFISDNDIDKVIGYIKSYAGNPNYDPNFLELDEEEPKEEKDENVDDVYETIKDFVIKTGLTGKNTIMRNFSLTSSKADQYLSKLANEDIIELGMGGKYVLSPRFSL